VPATYLELTRAAARDDIGLSDLAAIVEKDPALAVRVLQLANSAFFGQAKPRASVRDAVSFLGTEVLKGLALSASVFAAASSMAVDGLSHEELQRHSMDTARVARRFLDDKDRSQAAFTGALLHDVGRIVLAMSVRERYAAVVKRQRTEGGYTHLLEREMLGATHSEVGGYLLGLWGLPLSLVEAVAYHHEPSTMAEPPTDVVMAVHVADAFTTAPAELREDPSVGGNLDLAAVERAGLLGSLPRWRAIALEELSGGGI
jgi:HD-like signal output (HDOD) protein